MLFKNEILKQKFEVLSDFNFYNASDLKTKFLQRVSFSRKSISLKSTILKKKKFFKKHDFEQKLFLKVRFWKTLLHTKNQVLIQFPRKKRTFCVLRAILKSTILKKKFILKSMILNEKVFVKSMILYFELEIFHFVGFWIKTFSTRQFSNQLFFNVSDLKSSFYWILNKLHVLFT